jgi:shikimate dehydrogenase
LISGATTVAGVIGSPIRHSSSPAILNAAFAATGLDWVFVAFEVPDGSAPAALAGMRTLGLGGLSVTMPHKAAVAAAVDRLTEDARVLEAVNCVVPSGRALLGANTDGAGLLDSLRDAAVDPAGRRCVVLGGGGAARATVLALAGAGAREVVVVNRSADRAAAAAALAGTVGRVGNADEAGDADIVVNATPVGMAGTPDEDSVAVDASALGAGQAVVDLVYRPAVTPLLRAAASAGAVTVGGIGMLVHQAAHAFRLWTGEEPPIQAMREAVDTTH